MLGRYIKFFINGAVLGVVAWGLQSFIFSLLKSNSAIYYGIASALTYLPLIIVNFSIQRKYIFHVQGVFWRFCVANLCIMIFVSLLSSLFKNIPNAVFWEGFGEQYGFVIAALIGSVPSFFIKQKWVFKINKQ